METDKISRLMDLFNADPFADRMGVRIIELRQGFARVEMTLDESHLNFNNFVHGGVIFTLMDQAFAAASNSHNQSSVAISLDLQFIKAPKPGQTLVAEGREVERSRKLGLYQMEVRDEEGTLICQSHGRVYRIGEPILK